MPISHVRVGDDDEGSEYEALPSFVHLLRIVFGTCVYLLTASFSILYDPLMRMRASCRLP